MALSGAIEKPILGWGQEGFNYIFNKYYDPSLYAQEPWFDRAHNAFIDWLIAGGVPAFLLYLSLFGTAIVMLWRSSELSRPERTLLTAALVGYAVHNLFVFDNLYSYVYFFAILALIDSQTARPIQEIEDAPVLSAEDGMTYALPVAVACAVALIWFVNVPGMQVAGKLIVALSPSPSGLDANIATFEDLAAHPSFAAQEIREQIVSFAASLVQSTSATDAQKNKVATLATTEMQKQVAAYPLDAREHLQLSYVYRATGDTENALKEIQTAVTLSPKKESMWIELGVTNWDKNDVKATQEDFNIAYALGPQFSVLAVYAAAGDISAGDLSGADKILLSTFGTTSVDSDVLAVAYYRTKNWQRLIGIELLRVASPSATVDTWFALAAAYYTSGDKANAIKTIQDAVTRFPEASTSGAAAIKQITAK
jgi:tetratricopeptide (TPR) repeat protein